jgi:hypothetical protein
MRESQQLEFRRLEDRIDLLQGRLMATELLLSRLIWHWANEAPRQPPTTIDRFFQDIEQTKLSSLSSDLPPAQMQALNVALRNFSESLATTLRQAALDHTIGQGKGK